MELTMPTAPTETQLAAGRDQLVLIPIEDLHESPFNHRLTFAEAGLQELAADIKAQGILSPLRVRPRVPALFAATGDANLMSQARIGFELVFGHRRLRAAAIAGLAVAPCMVCAMSDQEVKRAQISENLSREDVHPIEEAEGFRALMQEHGQTADDIVAQTGKSRSYVYGRLKLLALCPEVRKAVLAGEIGSEVGLLVARVGAYKLQEKALGYIRGKALDLGDGGKQSFRRIRALLNERFTLDLKSAIFDTEDEMLVPSAGHCVRCPKRSGNSPLFDDVLNDKDKRPYIQTNRGADVCTDPDCFDAKKRAHLAREAAKLQAQGKTVVAGTKARAAMDAYGAVKGAYVSVDKVRDALKAASKAGAPAPQRVLIQDPRTGRTVEAVRREDLQVAGVQAPAEQKRQGYGGHNTPADREAQKARAQQEADALRTENGWRKALFMQVRASAASVPRSEQDLRAVVSALLVELGHSEGAFVADLWGCDHAVDLDEQLDAMRAPQLGQLLMDAVWCTNVRLHSHYSLHSMPEPLLAAAKQFGIDVDEVKRTALPEAGPVGSGDGGGDDDDDDGKAPAQ